MGPDCAIRSKQYAMQLTHADWLAVPHRDPSDITPLRSLKPRPGRSMYLYREETRDTATLRARLRLNRANIALNMDRGRVTVGPGLCLACSARQQQPVPESGQHMLMDCPRYASLRQRLVQQLRSVLRLPGRPPPPAAAPVPLSLATILGGPTGLLPPSASADQKNSVWARWLACTGQLLRRISQTRLAAGLPAL